MRLNIFLSGNAAFIKKKVAILQEGVDCDEILL